jgi:hypothetical protein
MSAMRKIRHNTISPPKRRKKKEIWEMKKSFIK